MEVVSATMTPTTSGTGTSPAGEDVAASSPLSSAEQLNGGEDDLNDTQVPDLNLGKTVEEVDNEPEGQATIRQRKNV